MKLKLLRAAGIGMIFGVGVILGISLPILLIWRIATALHKTVELRKSGTRVMATVTRIATYKVGRPIISTSGVGDRVAPEEVYRLFARWQHPETGKLHTLSGTVKDPSKFPIGSSVAFLVDYNNPKWHWLEGVASNRSEA